jgi:hypothetical protein
MFAPGMMGPGMMNPMMGGMMGGMMPGMSGPGMPFGHFHPRQMPGWFGRDMLGERRLKQILCESYRWDQFRGPQDANFRDQAEQVSRQWEKHSRTHDWLRSYDMTGHSTVGNREIRPDVSLMLNLLFAAVSTPRSSGATAHAEWTSDHGSA